MDVNALAGKGAIVTGGAGQIGLALAQALLDAGMRVMIADLDEAGLRNAASRLGSPEALTWRVLDVTNAEAWSRIADEAEAFAGPTALLCNNAGVSGTRTLMLHELPFDQWRSTIDVNLNSIFIGVQAIAPRMIAAGGGHIINTASLGPFVSSVKRGDYCASKSAVVSFSETLRDELAPLGVTVSVLCPGPIGHQVGAAQGDALPPGRMAPAEGVRRALEVMRRGEFYLFTHPENRASVTERVDRIVRAFNVLEDAVR